MPGARRRPERAKMVMLLPVRSGRQGPVVWQRSANRPNITRRHPSYFIPHPSSFLLPPSGLESQNSLSWRHPNFLRLSGGRRMSRFTPTISGLVVLLLALAAASAGGCGPDAGGPKMILDSVSAEDTDGHAADGTVQPDGLGDVKPPKDGVDPEDGIPDQAGDLAGPDAIKDSVCLPDCADKECGDDGCGGQCGKCPLAAPHCVKNVCSVECVADCVGKKCGEDGCGGTCGQCTGGQEVCSGGQCICAPACLGKECGPDGCGGECAECPLAAPFCMEGKCEAACEPQCDNKECGDDGCGEVCGKCPLAAPYCLDGLCQVQCVPDCYGKSCGENGCGGLCGQCPGNFTCQLGACVCAPNCDLKECGADGCGGVCGTCPENLPVCSQNKCLAACTPNCTNKQCGPDGCGGNCGVCAPGTPVCTNGICTASCTPNCTNKQCGDNGCGGSCGACPADKPMCSSGQCVGNCVPFCFLFQCGDDGCGGSCGTCGPGQVCSSGFCFDECTPDCTNKVCGSDGCNGTCGTCSAGKTCSSGACVSCSAGKVADCDGSCENSSLIGDGTCDDGLFGPDFNCSAFQYDHGDCDECTPKCTNKECGSDGCGGTCGSCYSNESCQSGECVANPSGCGSITYTGCCQAETMKYCSNSTTLTVQNCLPQSCGWDPTNKYYDCGFYGADPSGEYPINCPEGN